ncbi:MAG: ABC transporter ATP-binding protein [Bacteroidetes bacterium]|nr:ABC transporter ATP-binding protein [Bacteroidota bacterium]
MLIISNLSKTYSNGVIALKDVSLKINNGLFGLLGPNGAGKSTLMRTIATLQEPDSGNIYFDELDVLKSPQLLRADLGYLPQDFGVYPRISAVELLDHLAILKGILNKKEREEQVKALLDQTNLYKMRKKAVSNFSGGMKQRFGIAQALLGDPHLIIVDEPTAGLDPEERNRFHNLLSEIGEDKVVILSTHIVEDVSDLCPDMAILADGKILLQGTPIKLINELKGSIWHKTILKEELNHYKSNLQIISTHLFSGKTQIHVLSNSRPDNSFEEVAPDLEDVYFSTIFNQASN